MFRSAPNCFEGEPPTTDLGDENGSGLLEHHEFDIGPGGPLSRRCKPLGTNNLNWRPDMYDPEESDSNCGGSVFADAWEAKRHTYGIFGGSSGSFGHQSRKSGPELGEPQYMRTQDSMTSGGGLAHRADASLWPNQTPDTMNEGAGPSYVKSFEGENWGRTIDDFGFNEHPMSVIMQKPTDEAWPEQTPDTVASEGLFAHSNLMEADQLHRTHESHAAPPGMDQMKFRRTYDTFDDFRNTLDSFNANYQQQPPPGMGIQTMEPERVHLLDANHFRKTMDGFEDNALEDADRPRMIRPRDLAAKSRREAFGIFDDDYGTEQMAEEAAAPFGMFAGGEAGCNTQFQAPSGTLGSVAAMRAAQALPATGLQGPRAPQPDFAYDPQLTGGRAAFGSDFARAAEPSTRNDFAEFARTHQHVSMSDFATAPQSGLQHPPPVQYGMAAQNLPQEGPAHQPRHVHPGEFSQSLQQLQLEEYAQKLQYLQSEEFAKASQQSQGDSLSRRSQPMQPGQYSAPQQQRLHVDEYGGGPRHVTAEGFARDPQPMRSGEYGAAPQHPAAVEYAARVPIQGQPNGYPMLQGNWPSNQLWPLSQVHALPDAGGVSSGPQAQTSAAPQTAAYNVPGAQGKSAHGWRSGVVGPHAGAASSTALAQSGGYNDGSGGGKASSGGGKASKRGGGAKGSSSTTPNGVEAPRTGWKQPAQAESMPMRPGLLQQQQHQLQQHQLQQHQLQQKQQHTRRDGKANTAANTPAAQSPQTSSPESMGQALHLAQSLGVQQQNHEDGPLTLMIRNVPSRYTQEMLLEEWPNHGTYDFLYLPFCLKSRRNQGFVFISFVTPAHAEAFRLHWNKKRLGRHDMKKALDISLADVQGRFQTLQKLTKHKMCRIKNVHFQPAIFDANGSRISVEEYIETAKSAAGLLGVDLRDANANVNNGAQNGEGLAKLLSATIDTLLASPSTRATAAVTASTGVAATAPQNATSSAVVIGY